MTRPPYSDDVKDAARLLKQEGLSNRKIADQLGVGRRTVDNWLADVPPVPGTSDGSDGGGASERPAADAPPTGRTQERKPRRPADGKVAAPVRPPDDAALNLQAVRGYIEGAYKLAGKVAEERGDAVLAAAISEHADPAARAWARWIESEPRVQELLRKLMVGTPAGEVIAVHVSLVFSYVVARGAAERIAAEAAVAAAADADAARTP